jgi:MFS family permease
MKTSRYAWALVALLWVVAILNYLDRQVIFSLFPPLQKEFNVTAAQLGLLSTFFLWVYGLVSPLGGFLADRYSRKKIIILSLVIWSAVTWLTGHVTSFNQLLGARALMGISEACYIPAALALIADHHGERTRSLATGLHQSGIYLGVILGGWFGGWMGQHYGWRTAFTLLGITGVGYALVLLPGIRATNPTRATAAAGKGNDTEQLRFLPALAALFGQRKFVLLAIAAMLFSIAGWIVMTWLPLYLYEQFQMSLAGAGFSATFWIQAAAFGGILGGGWLADRWSATNPRARVLIPLSGFLAGGVFLFLVGWTSSQAVLIPGLIVYGLSRGFWDCNLMPMLCQIAPPNLRATGYGIFNMAGTVVGGTLAWAAGALKDAIGLGGALQMSALLLGVAALILLPIKFS